MKKELFMRLMNSFMPIVLLLGAIFFLIIFAKSQAEIDAEKTETIHIAEPTLVQNESEEEYDDDTEIEKSHNEPLYVKAKEAFESKDYKGAESLYYEILSQKPSAEAYNLLGLTQVKLKAYKKALAAYHSSLYYDKKYYRAYYNRAHIYSIRKEFAKAIKDYQSTLRFQPYHFKSYYNMGRAQYKSAQYLEAERSFGKAASLSSGIHKSRALYQQALCLLKFEKPQLDKAVAILNTAIRIQPDALLPRLLLIKQTMNEQDQLRSLKKISDLYPHKILPVTTMATIYRNQGKIKSAMSLYSHYLQSNSQDAQALYNYAKFLYDAQEYEKAKHLLIQATEIDKKNSSAFILLGKSLYKSGSYQKAIEQYTNALKLHKNLSAVYVEISQCHKKLKDKKQQLAALKKALSKDQKNSDALLEMGKYELYAKNYRQAGEWIEQSIKIDKEREYAWFIYGELFNRQKKSSEAINAYEKCLALNPDYIKAQLALAELYYTASFYAKSIEMSRKIINANPSYIEAWEYLGKSLYQTKEYRLAEDAVIKGLKLAPSKSDLKIQLARIYEKTQRRGEAFDIYLELIDMNPADILMYYNYAKALAENSMYPEALAVLNKALLLRPDHQRSIYLKKTIETKLKERP